jgi:CubicO group peptidase (beta-lactamase class C family)
VFLSLKISLKLAKLLSTPSISFTVLHQSDAIYKHHHGYHDIETKLEPKTTNAALVGTEVYAGTFDWETPVKDLLPEFASSDPMAQEKCTILDLLSHRSGIEGP